MHGSGNVKRRGSVGTFGRNKAGPGLGGAGNVLGRCKGAGLVQHSTVAWRSSVAVLLYIHALNRDKIVRGVRPMAAVETESQKICAVQWAGDMMLPSRGTGWVSQHSTRGVTTVQGRRGRPKQALRGVVARCS